MILRGLRLAAVFGVGLPLSASVLVSSNWDNAADGVDGWSFTADGSNLIRVATGGNPGGFLQVAAREPSYFERLQLSSFQTKAPRTGALNYDLQPSEGDRQSPEISPR
jgi:hypothetical protein